MKNQLPKSLFIFIGIFLLIIFSCKKEIPKVAPTIETSVLTDITPNSATCGGVITSDGGSPITECGVCWSTKENPTITDNKTIASIGIGTFTSSITSLSSGATYYFRAYATNSIGTSYGNQVTTTTKEESIQFEVSPFNGTAYVDIKSEVLPFTVKVLSKIPSSGITYSVKMVQYDNSQIVFKLDTTTVNNNVVLQLGKFSISKAYTITIDAKSKANPTNSSTKTFPAKRNRVYKNYLKTSYELSNYDMWLSSDDYYYKGVKYPYFNPLVDQQFCQIDIDGDGLEDIFYYDSYDISTVTNSTPPSVYMNHNSILEKIDWTGPSILCPHGSKLLVGDFNNDSIPDIFTCVGFDVPNGVDWTNQVSHLILNSKEGFKTVKEFPEQLGFHHSGCSGDIDNDGDLDVIMFNFGYWGNGVTSKILWNDGKGNFTFQESGFSKYAPVDHSELFDVNNDGFLDLVFSFINNQLGTKNIVIMWGNGKTFDIANSISFDYPTYRSIMDIDLTDINNDGISEIILSGTDLLLGEGTQTGVVYFIDLYQSYDKGKTFVKKTNEFFDVADYFPRFGHMIFRDLDHNGRIDIYGSDRKANTRWEWNGSKFIKK
ncbi:MAG: FG-GAP-like repeat-containing protein [Prolixibacteraceae bacterium]|nr:FG-GAP-like repeat-containing protein [Prolixibacteraceae bacterium]